MFALLWDLLVSKLSLISQEAVTLICCFKEAFGRAIGSWKIHEDGREDLWIIEMHKLPPLESN